MRRVTRTSRRFRRFRRGVTLLEMGVAVTIIGILVAFTVPSFTRVSEQSRVDAAAQYLRSIWSAQRVYWLENRTFASSLAQLDALGLIDPKIATGNDGYFTYALGNVGANSFTATATRSGSGRWSGTLQITEDGDVTGNESDGGGTVLIPPDL
jgi:prepilin-type N-terminal cleavage/methylation domain-containing protein